MPGPLKMQCSRLEQGAETQVYQEFKPGGPAGHISGPRARRAWAPECDGFRSGWRWGCGSESEAGLLEKTGRDGERGNVMGLRVGARWGMICFVVLLNMSMLQCWRWKIKSLGRGWMWISKDSKESEQGRCLKPMSGYMFADVKAFSHLYYPITSHRHCLPISHCQECQGQVAWEVMRL